LFSHLQSKNVKIKTQKTTILPTILYGCETSLSLRDKHRLNECNKRVLRRIFGPMIDKTVQVWTKLHNELHNSHSSPNMIRIMKSRRMRWEGHKVCMGEERNTYRLLVEKPEGKTPLGRPRYRWKDNIKIDLSEIG
jgi:hypothetical protein